MAIFLRYVHESKIGKRHALGKEQIYLKQVLDLKSIRPVQRYSSAEIVKIETAIKNPTRQDIWLGRDHKMLKF